MHSYGQFDLNRTPLAPPFTRAVAHVKPNKCRSWAPYGVDAWYVGPDFHHYRCYQVYVTSTNSLRIVDTLELFPQHVKMPQLSTAYRTIQAARELTHALCNPASAAPFAQIGYEQHEELAKLATIFEEITDPDPVHYLVQDEPQLAHSSKVPSPDPMKAPEPVPSPRVEALGPASSMRVSVPSTRVPTPLSSPYAHRIISRTPRTPRPPPIFDLCKQRRKTTRSAARSQSPGVVLHVQQNLMQDLEPATRNLMDDIHAEASLLYNTQSGEHMHEANHVATFIPYLDPAVTVNYCMPMANEDTHPDTGHALNLRQLLRDETTKPKWDGGQYKEFGRLFQAHNGGIKGTNTCFFIKHSDVPQGICLCIQAKQTHIECE
jgi:hypothetical protein